MCVFSDANVWSWEYVVIRERAEVGCFCCVVNGTLPPHIQLYQLLFNQVNVCLETILTKYRSSSNSLYLIPLIMSVTLRKCSLAPWWCFSEPAELTLLLTEEGKGRNICYHLTGSVTEFSTFPSSKLLVQVQVSQLKLKSAMQVRNIMTNPFRLVTENGTCQNK